MGKMGEYHEKQRLMQELQQDLQRLEEDKELKNMMEFRDNLKELMESHNIAPKDAMDSIVDLHPQAKQFLKDKESDNSNSSGKHRRLRPLMRYRNPHTGEVVETRGGNQKQLKQWRDQYGKEVVDQWRERVDG